MARKLLPSASVFLFLSVGYWIASAQGWALQAQEEPARAQEQPLEVTVEEGTGNYIFRYQGPVTSNDVLMSLVNGGLFDINHNWQQPHMEHREGRNADVRTEPSIHIPSCSGKPNAIPNDTGVRARWANLCDFNNITCRLEKVNTCKEHYHLIK